MARVLLISDEEAIGLLWGAKAGGHDVYVTGVRSRNPTVSINPKCKQFFPLPEGTSFEEPDSFDELAEVIADLASRLKIDVIVPTSFESVKFAILQGERLAAAAHVVPLAPMEKVALLDDKYSFFRFCEEHGFPHPASCLLQSSADLEKPELSGLVFPLLTKPLMGVSEIGIERFETREELTQRVASAPASFFPVLAQEWFDGEDIDFNGYALEGEVPVSSVMRTHRYQWRGAAVGLIEFVSHEEVSRLGHEMVRKSGFTGPLNVDLRIRKSDQKLFFIEVNPRFWGRSMACLIDGLSFVDAGIRLPTDPQWRKTSRSDGRIWASSIMPLVKGTLRGDRTAWGFLRRISAVQIWFQFHSRVLTLLAKLRGSGQAGSQQ